MLSLVRAVCNRPSGLLAGFTFRMAGTLPIRDDLKFVEASEALNAVASGSTTIVDVRRPDEWDVTHIKNSVHIPLDKFQDKATLDSVIQETISKIEGPVCVTCFQSLKRGPAAASALIARLQELGHSTDHITVLKGGVEGISNDPELSKVLEGNGSKAAAEH